MNNTVFLLVKDCCPVEALPLYGNTYWKTPNIDELAAKGTVFRRHYTAAGSTSMSVSAMLSGHYPYEFAERKTYTHVRPSEFPSIFDTMQEADYECHIIWDFDWMRGAWPYVREFGDESKTQIHELAISQPAGHHRKSIGERVVRSDEVLERTYKQISDTLGAIDFTKKQFIYMHLPHVLLGRRSYMDDIDAFDHIVGMVRSLVGDEGLFITSDHGHMNWHKGKLCYGFDVYEPVIHIPLITPRVAGLEEFGGLTCNIDIPLLLTGGVPRGRDYVITDTQYYGQPRRVTAIVESRFKYVYFKEDGREELYDLLWDPREEHNILQHIWHDPDRNRDVVADELYFYPEDNERLAEEALERLRDVKGTFWQTADWRFEKYTALRAKLAPIKRMLTRG